MLRKFIIYLCMVIFILNLISIFNILYSNSFLFKWKKVDAIVEEKYIKTVDDNVSTDMLYLPSIKVSYFVNDKQYVSGVAFTHGVVFFQESDAIAYLKDINLGDGKIRVWYNPDSPDDIKIIHFLLINIYYKIIVLLIAFVIYIALDTRTIKGVVERFNYRLNSSTI